ncbi:MAG TPA: arginine--tRNA ligase [Anaerolineae bacterium]|nr:arginine--tRNA ligase [Anaerolineae bacterium]
MAQLIRDQIADLIRTALLNAQQSNALPAFDVPRIDMARPKLAAHGDYSTSLALTLAKTAGRPPLQIAERIAAHIPAHEALGKVEVAKPGHINVTLSEAWLAQQVQAILDAGPEWANLDLGGGRRVQVEHGSANPTGPLTIGSGRNVVIGDTLANILQASGYAVQREYYVNDAGSQVRHFGESIYARYAQALGQAVPFPEDGYKGAYIAEIAQTIIREHGDRFLGMDKTEASRALGQIGIDQMVEGAQQTLARANIHFEEWFHERWLHESGLFSRMLDQLREKDLLYERDDAIWFKVTAFGGEKDAVIVRAPKVIPDPLERPTYFGSDIAYVHNKFIERGFDRVIYVWGADHHGDLPRMQAIRAALGIAPDRLVIILYQLVTLTRGGEEVRQSKRTGEFITLDEVIDEIGADAIRFMLLTRSVDSKITLDLELAKEQSDQNPVYYVQYAHARIASILRKAADVGVPQDAPGEVRLLAHPSELTLIRKMLELPLMIEQSVRDLAPHHLTHYAQDLASTFSAFYRDCKVVDASAPELTAARLMLCRAAKLTLARALGLMGMSAPESM